MCVEPTRYIPSEQRRALRKEVCFCCPVCGSPLLEYHHIIPWAKIKEHVIENMIALCPGCHSLADNATYSKSLLYQLKKAGKNSPGWKNSIRFYSEKFYLQVGNITFEKPHNILEIDNNPLLSIEYSEDNNIILNTVFYDSNNQEILSVRDNELSIKAEFFWDIEYNGKYLILRKRLRKIMFEMEIYSEYLWLKKGIYQFGTSILEFFHNGFSVNTGKTCFKSIDEIVVFSSGNGIKVFSEGRF